jgi:hypothetical protein
MSKERPKKPNAPKMPGKKVASRPNSIGRFLQSTGV